MNRKRHQVVQRSRSERETLRTKGQFWTPDWVAEFMVAYALQDQPKRLLDPALGEGVFFRVAKRYAESHRFYLSLFGRDIDMNIVAQARQSGLNDNDLRNVEIRDFVLDPPTEQFPAIIANPPYIRHHRLSTLQKASLRDFARTAIGRHIDGRAGLHVYFLIRALQTLSPGGRLCYIVSADICEGVFAQPLWQWIASRNKFDAVITFSPEATPFPDMDTNVLVFCIQKEQPNKHFHWLKCRSQNAEELISFLSGNRHKQFKTLEIHHRSVDEAIKTGLSRPPTQTAADRYTLGDFASVMRGIVTGDIAFFFMTLKRARELGIPKSMLIKAVGRTRDIEGDLFCCEDVKRLEAKGRPTRLLNVNGLAFDQLPATVQAYLEEGASRGIDKKTLIRTRNPWYRVETRTIPPIMFAYLGRRNARFIRNCAGVVPLNCLLCVYPNHPNLEFVEHLWNILSHPETINNLRMVGKSYGGDAIKVEPRALERLPLPDHLVQTEGIEKYAKPKQCTLFD
ncbi:MAG TPA: N-6 DNA methylase [Candidatus Sumerlaeota bacterium]|nr:MAG: Modification methylase Eco57IB [candidate division BRC1 bacterium ADurb.Bin183]HOE63822.1 N-6 DNA methylase [Candidatus Sumerlaeota bacterium]HRR32154.1 N-6 DNA methylase [Candidatus Sumerlaeia bacterium]HON49727.1 N-6 DNA methylase [Candidatus Sumerlaeota bacterium]HOR64025.1 N-6 DNA methylase [Candidatus Sumerlaeota bacterium]